MIIKKIDHESQADKTEELTVYLIKSTWNDWWEYESLFLMYISYDNSVKNIGTVKIGDVNDTYITEKIVTNLPKETEQLKSNFISVGQDASYYMNLRGYNNDIRIEILEGLRDIAYDSTLFEIHQHKHLVYRSLLRDVNRNLVTGQFRRLAQGGALLTEYNFSYTLPKPTDDNELLELLNDAKLNVEVEPNTHPSTNLHVLIGRNGVGKTNLLKNFVSCLLSQDDNSHGSVQFTSKNTNEKVFANIVTLSYSVFDNSNFHFVDKNQLNDMSYYEISLMKDFEGTRSPKTIEDMTKEFKEALEKISRRGKIHRWKKAIEILNSDPIFSKIGVQYLIERQHQNKIAPIFNKLSSGHTYVLLTVTFLIDVLEERSLLIMDEPETHLHPPLIASLMRVVSELLTYRNAVGVIATHSPVVLQEVPRNCVTIMNRSNFSVELSRPKIQTFGENVGTLTREVFGLENHNSGYHSLLKAAVDKFDTFEDVSRYFNKQLGAEAKTIVRTLLLLKGKEDTNE